MTGMELASAIDIPAEELTHILRQGALLRLPFLQGRHRLAVEEVRHLESKYNTTEHDTLRVGWDNAPHHTQVDSFPHHKHLGDQGTIASSSETRLEEVMAAIEDMLADQ